VPASASTSPEEATNIQQQPVADYPRPRSPPKEVDANANEDLLNGAATTAVNDEEGGTKTGGGANRKERRRQERKKDKYQTEEDKMHNEMLQKNELPFDVKGGNKDARGADKLSKRAPSASANAPRITQPVSRFMA
jgi:hypothetical protein